MDQTDKLQLTIEETSKEPQQKKQDQESKWKSKSLNSLPTQHYEMDITKSLQPKKIQTKQTQKQPKQTQKQGKKPQTNQKVLPAPKIKKINEKTFCITIDNQINVFYLLDANQKIKLKTKKSFGMIKHEIGSNIEFTAGNNSNFIFIGTLTELIILDLYKKQDKYFIKQMSRKQIPNLRAVTFVASQLIAVSSDQVYQYNLGNFDLVAKKSIQFQKDQDRKLFNTLKPVGLVVESIFCFYYFGTIVQQKIDYNAKKKYAVEGGPPPSRQCEVLHIVKFKIQQNLQIVTLTGENQQARRSNKMMTVSQLAQSRIISIKIQIFPIDHVFQTGIFQKSKIFEIQESVFLMSLHQEIILIKKHFNKFIVWDNVSIVSSKSQQKKGQLVLADKRILVYSQNGEIFAHDIFFNEEESRINMPPIDGFRGNDNDQQILYDAVLLQYDKESLMKVLFYFKQIDVILPNKSKFRKQAENPTQVHDQNTLHFTMLCINQSDPKQKLKQLLRLKKQPNQIAQFCQRFGINSLQKTKCMWSVSDKSLKDIENVLLEISDDKYIQTELDNILKKEPHNLTFLISVQKKQIARLKKLLVRNMLNDSQTSQATIVYSVDGTGESARKKIEYAKKVIQWLMESIMFQKKLDYSKNFLSFKEYDFIEIGKLKAASLKQQIKLLSCKKYQKRLKYFLNSFKILAIANWQQIFRFLLINKNQHEIQQFLIEFGFILPKFFETSHVFQQKQQFDVISKQPRNQKKQHNQDEKCILWDDLQQIQTLIQQAVMNAGQQKSKVTNQSGQRPLNTIQDFQQMVIQNIKSFKKDKRQQSQAIQNFKKILKEIVDSNWFSVAAFKQHSMLNKTSKQLKQQFYQLKNRGAYKILVKYLYEQIQTSNSSITITGINDMLQQFVSLGIIPQSFKKNDDARLKVYTILSKKAIQNPSKQFYIPKKSQYLIWNEDQYFSFLFKHIKDEILKNVKKQYQQIQGGFFRQRFQLYLKSTFVNLKGIINFLSQFQQSSSDDVRVDIFNCIKRLLKLNDYQNTRDFIQKSLEKQVLPQKSGDVSNSAQMNLRQQAKIPYGFVFYHFFKVFNLDYTYEQLIQSTQNANLQTNNILKQLIHKYCAGLIIKDTDYDNKEQCKIIFEDHKITNQKAAEVDILDEPLQFFGVLLYMVSILEFQVVEEDLFKFMLQEYLNQGKVDMITLFINSIMDYTINTNSLNTKNYQLITDFKESHNTQEIFIEYSLGWISRNYSQIKQSSRIQNTLKSIESVLNALKKFPQQKIRNEQHLFSLLSFIKRFNPQLIMKVDFIKQELNHSGFIFLMHIFRQIGVDCFINCNCEAQQSQQSSNQSTSNALKQNSSSINTKIYYFNLIFDKYKQITKCEVSKNQNQATVEFVRFLVELCCVLIGQKKYQMAWQLLLRSVSNSYYYNDAFFYFASVCKIQKVSQFKEALRIYLGVDTTKILVQKLREMLKNQQNSNRMLSIAQQKPSIFDIKGRQHHQNVQNNYLFLFEELVQNNRVDQACYFLIRIRSANMKLIQEKLKSNTKYGKSLQSQAYILLVVYFKCLQKYISEQFYPTFLFFKTKFLILIDNQNRKDIIKDINIAISRLKQKFDEEDDKNQLLKKDIEESYRLLKQYYELYMISIHEDPVIKLTVEDEQLATKRIQMYAKITPQDDREGLFEQESRQQKQAKLRLQQNQLKMNQIHEKNKLNVVRKQVNQSISEARRNADKYANMLQEKKKQQAKISYAQKKEKQIEEIKRKEMEDVASIKQSYKSTTTQKVNDLIQNLRKKRQNISEHRSKNIALRQEVTQNVKQVPSRDYQNMPQPYKPSSQNLPSSKYQVPVKIQNDNLMPVTAKIGMKSNEIIQNMKKSNVVDRQGLKKQQGYKINSKNKISRQEIADLLKQKEPQAYKYLQKFDLIKQNLQIAVQLVKRMYSATNNLQNFVQFIKYLLDLDPKYKQILQQKSLPIVAQMIKMSQKINLKQLVCPQLFINVQKVAVKDYYDIVYTTLRPNIMKILEKQDVTIHSLGILLRYSLGSETKYFNKTVIDYIKVLLKNYSSKVYDDKQVMVLAQKLRNQYLSMQEQNRENNFQQLINEIPSQNTKKKLVDALGRVNVKKSESVLGGKQAQQFSRIIKRLSK